MGMKKISARIAYAALVIGGLFFLGIGSLAGEASTYYYTRIDNSKIEEGDPRGGVIDLRGGMRYIYTLPAYDENGGRREITFGAERELREGAFIRLTVVPVRGVMEWSEVQHEEMPAAVREKL